MADNTWKIDLMDLCEYPVSVVTAERSILRTGMQQQQDEDEDDISPGKEKR
ncbi:hypothetical protein MMC32_004461 [Xylographa parallela]|nr:hypothetical protein [Xylographa parallela]